MDCVDFLIDVRDIIKVHEKVSKGLLEGMSSIFFPIGTRH